MTYSTTQWEQVMTDPEYDAWLAEQAEHQCKRCEGSGDLGTGRLWFNPRSGQVQSTPKPCPDCNGTGIV